MSRAEAAALLLDDLVSALAERIAPLIAAANPPAEPLSPWMNIKTAAKYLDTSEQALRGRIKRGEIPVHRREGRLYFNRHELDQWVRGEIGTA
jgi:excisionase family DNA binding protein